MEYVWIHHVKNYGVLVHYGAEYSLIRYDQDGLEIEEWLENDDFELRSERAFEYEQDDE